mmetsp:Transcript_21733/g.47226  ORF Transcript_21733/g.47226 Transcript_21733/m.47226 type:complete len:203 (+) Transcript_21733:58-666(+)
MQPPSSLINIRQQQMIITYPPIRKTRMFAFIKWMEILVIWNCCPRMIIVWYITVTMMSRRMLLLLKLEKRVHRSIRRMVKKNQIKTKMITMMMMQWTLMKKKMIPTKKNWQRRSCLKTTKTQSTLSRESLVHPTTNPRTITTSNNRKKMILHPPPLILTNYCQQTVIIITTATTIIITDYPNHPFHFLPILNKKRHLPQHPH